MSRLRSFSASLRWQDSKKLMVRKRKLSARGDDVDGAGKRLAESFVADVTAYLGIPR